MTSDLSILNIAAYKFVTLADPQALRAKYRPLCRELGLKGTIIFAPEGINLMLAGPVATLEGLWQTLISEPAFADLTYKGSFSDRQPFNRMLVKVKPQIVSLGNAGDYNPLELTAENLPPETLKAWLDEGRDFTLLDTRNNYEIKMGTFEKAIDFDLDHFREFPAAVDEHNHALDKDKPLVMFCTGGIRCEKASADMLRKGYKQVYQLQGGILEYFKQCGGKHYRGDCFVFDYRVALDLSLQETSAVVCYKCLNPLTDEEQQSAAYELGVTCPYCISNKTVTPLEKHC